MAALCPYGCWQDNHYFLGGHIATSHTVTAQIAESILNILALNTVRAWLFFAVGGYGTGAFEYRGGQAFGWTSGPWQGGLPCRIADVQ